MDWAGVRAEGVGEGESRTHASHCLSEQAFRSPSCFGPFSAPVREARESEGQGRAQGVGSEEVGPSGSLRDRGGGGGAARRRLRRRSGWLLSSGPLLLPHLSHAACDLRPSIPGPRETGPGPGRRRKGIQRHGAAATSAPGRAMRICGVWPRGSRLEVRRYRNAPPLHAFSRWAARDHGERTIHKCKGIIVVLCPWGTIVSSSAGRPGVSPGFEARTPLPAPIDLLYRVSPDLFGCPWPFLSI